MTTRLIGLSGSLRGGSTNRKLLREAARLFGEADYTEADLDLPLYNGDNEDRDGVPGVVITLAKQIRDADAVLISTPEYNSGISGVMKNALDWISRTDVKPWSGKPVAVMSAAAGRAGGVRGQSMLRHCMTPFRVRLVPGPEIGVADARNQFDEGGRLTSDLYQKSLGDLMQALRREIERGA
ncbi:NAD(P)H-dependent FMN reductase [Salinihabitans flavidus]|uniref:NAD(P)H-dependent FMN reductase n=1 Tax=Salinihabitans flavidus TaxID=569882 RepID=A0A1H8RW37_9RHOB|nr:NADPH-dependent FMN reductase [Salinihabitans flavidus]SEO70869.1 NAD(P)H-dependent FMN reductase [Salinihabitans flavidus]